MGNDTLNTIQTIAKIGKVMSAIAHVCFLVGCIACIMGICCAGIPGSIRVGGVAIYSLIQGFEGFDLGTFYTAMIVGTVFCISGCVITKLAENYFKNELEAGTPFTHAGSNQLLKLGICTICVPLATTIAVNTLYVIARAHVVGLASLADLSIDASVPVGLGIAIIILSLVCKYGAEQADAAN